MKLTENQEKWLTALESGDYKQGTANLRSKDKFCCLGVACDLFFEGETKVWYNSTVYYEGIGYDAFLPPSVVTKLNMLNNEGDFGDLGVFYGYSSLWEVNDDGVPFAEIAAFIRANPKLIFKNEEQNEGI